jgi:hypothetical protein
LIDPEAKISTNIKGLDLTPILRVPILPVKVIGGAFGFILIGGLIYRWARVRATN